MSDAEKASYTEALAYCSGDVARPMALRGDRRVLCLDGQVFAMSEIWLVSGLEQDGLFVVRGHGGDIAVSIQLAEMLLLKQATVVVSDYCLAICADFLFIASMKTFVPKDTLVAWINHATGPNNCLRFLETGDHGAPRLKKAPCVYAFGNSQTTELLRLKHKFYNGRVISPPFLEPPESVAVRRILKRKFDATGKYPDDVYWTWNPRHYAGAIRTKIFYEAYPQSQDEVDAIVARIGLRNSIIYDP